MNPVTTMPNANLARSNLPTLTPPAIQMRMTKLGIKPEKRNEQFSSPDTIKADPNYPQKGTLNIEEDNGLRRDWGYCINRQLGSGMHLAGVRLSDTAYAYAFNYETPAFVFYKRAGGYTQSHLTFDISLQTKQGLITGAIELIRPTSMEDPNTNWTFDNKKDRYVLDVPDNERPAVAAWLQSIQNALLLPPCGAKKSDVQRKHPK